MDKYVRPEGRITDFRTWVSGIQPHMLKPENGAITFAEAKKQANRVLSNCQIVVGHSLHHDFEVLEFEVDESKKHEKIRDLSRFPKYKTAFGQVKSLKNLTAEFLNRTIQQGSHSSVVDARASLALYRINEKEWEVH